MWSKINTASRRVTVLHGGDLANIPYFVISLFTKCEQLFTFHFILWSGFRGLLKILSKWRTSWTEICVRDVSLKGTPDKDVSWPKTFAGTSICRLQLFYWYLCNRSFVAFFASNLSPSGHSYITSLFTNEEHKKGWLVYSNVHFCQKCQPTLCHRFVK